MPGDTEQELIERAEAELKRELEKLRNVEREAEHDTRVAGDPATAGVAARMRHKSRAEATRQAGREVADLVYEKQLAYGDAASLQRGLWDVLLEQYRHDGEYRMPVALFDHVPRLTRVFDRVARLVANPEVDALGEDPWRDMAGDAIVGIVMPRTGDPAPTGSWDPDWGKPEWARTTTTRCSEGDCERPAGHGGYHRRADAAGVRSWSRRARG